MSSPRAKLLNMNEKSLRRLRLKAGLTQAELAGLIGIHPVTLSRIETGASTTSALVLQRLASALGVSASDIDLSSAEETKRAS